MTIENSEFLKSLPDASMTAHELAKLAKETEGVVTLKFQQGEEPIAIVCAVYGKQDCADFLKKIAEFENE